MKISNSRHRPSTVKFSVNLFFISLIIRYLTMLVSINLFGYDLILGDISKVLPTAYLIVGHLSKITVVVILLFQILKGSNIARKIFFVIALVDIITTIIQIPAMYSLSFLLTGLSLILIGIQCVSLSLLYLQSTARGYSNFFDSSGIIKNPSLVGIPAFLFFLISIFFSFVGTVNLGGMGIFPTIPFVAFMILASLDKRYGIVSRIFLAIFLSLYILKHTQTPVFYPAIGKSFYLRTDVCLEEHKLERTTTVRMSRLLEGQLCSVSESEGIIKVKKMLRGSGFNISGTIVKNDWFREEYVLQAETPIGIMEYSPMYDGGGDGSHLAKWANGKDIHVSDLYRNIFYESSQAMWILAKPFGFLIDRMLDTVKS